MPLLFVELPPDARQAQTAHVRPISYAAGQTLAQAVYLSGFFRPPVLCSGLSLCGRCRMRILSAPCLPEPTNIERRCFSQDELTLGWRLGCRHPAQPDIRIELPPGSGSIWGDTSSGIVFARGAGPKTPALPRKNLPSSSDPKLNHYQQYVLAIDLGTTTLEWAVTPQTSPAGHDPLSDALWNGSCVNPQMGAGSDVLSRLAVARSLEGRATLHKLTVNAVNALTRTAQQHARAAAPGADISALCLAGNPAMTALALDLDSAGLAAAPYSLPDRGGRWASLPDLPPLWIPPQLSPFVGGDLAAGYAFLALNPAAPPPVFPFVLADMGTNGEFLLALGPDKALAASVALGPALEGSGLSMGSEARPGAVSGFVLQPGGLGALVLREEDGPETGRAVGSGSVWRQTRKAQLCTMGLDSYGPAPEDKASLTKYHDKLSHYRAVPAKPVEQVSGITGTGYLSLLRLLLHARAIDEYGHFSSNAAGPLRGLFPPAQDARGERYLELPHGLRLYASDLEELLKVKAAFSLGLRRLLAAAGTASRDLSRVYLAGALGRHMDKEALETLGFFPPGFLPRLHAVGNSSLAGAALLLRHPPAREALTDWAAHVQTVNLAADPEFTGSFTSHMRFFW